ncbi:MAG: GNAT family N-acetyltransferase [Candidatus Woesearchaeota archaeon]
MISLQLPDVKYKVTYLDAIREFQLAGSDNETTAHYLTHSIEDLALNFQAFVDSLLDKHRGINLEEGRTPSTQYWIIDELGKYCGRISLRHPLTAKLLLNGGNIGYDITPSQRKKHYASEALTLCLSEAKKQGLTEVLLTCDDDNTPSIKIIELHGGILKDKLIGEGVLKRRYIISF